MEEFVNYRSFNDKAVAIELFKKLSDEGLAVKWEDSEGFFDVSFANDEFMNLYYIKLRKEDFEKADAILEGSVKAYADEPPEDYYLFSFSDEELMDVLQKPDEWNEFDRFWARKILQRKGIEIDPARVIEMKKQRISELKKPWEVHPLWKICAIALPVAAVFTLNIGWACGTILLGAYIAWSKKTLPNGERVTAFSAKDRRFGIIFLSLGVITLLWALLIYSRLLNEEAIL